MIEKIGEKKMYCAHCGKKIHDNAAFCAFCGKEITKKDDPIDCNYQASVNEETTQKPEKKVDSEHQDGDSKVGTLNAKKGLMVLAAVVLLVIIIAAVVLLVNNNNQKNDKEASSVIKASEESSVIKASEESSVDTSVEASSVDNKKWENLEPGATVFFGKYEQDNNTSNGPEDIEWIVLAKMDDSLLVISKYLLDCKPYDTGTEAVTWETCYLRGWLNNDFFNSAFSKDEQSWVRVTYLKDETEGTSKNTSNNVFILSATEASMLFNTDEERLCVPTDYAVAQGAAESNKTKVNGVPSGWWWLRSPGTTFPNSAAYIYDSGAVGNLGIFYGFTQNAIRPVICLVLK